MTTKRISTKRGRESSCSRCVDHMPDIALAAITSYKKQKEVIDFINYILEALDRNSNWLNNVVRKQSNFKCVLMSGAGPNRFQVQETIYPSNDEDIKLEVELNNSEDHDKIALAALMKIGNSDMENLLKYLKTRMSDNLTLKDDLLKGKGMGVSFAVLTPFSEKQYRVTERIILGGTCPEPCKKRRRDWLKPF